MAAIVFHPVIRVRADSLLARGGGRAMLIAFALALPLFAAPLPADDLLSPRLQIGIGILPAVIAANKNLDATPSQPLSVLLVYRDNRHLADNIRPGLEKIERVRQRRLAVETVSLAELLGASPPAGSVLFLVESLGDDLERLVAFARGRRLLLFSPFKGDVERGVTAGFRVTDKVLPMVNLTTLKQSNIHLKAFFLRVAVKHE